MVIAENGNKKWVLTAFDNTKTKKEKSVSAATSVTPNSNKESRAVAFDKNLSTNKGSESSSEWQANEQTKSSKNNDDTVGGSPVTLEYLLEGGQGSIENAGYFLHGVAAAFPSVTDAIEAIRQTMLQDERLGVSPLDFVAHDYPEIGNIRSVINNVYGAKGVELYNKLLANASGFVPREGKIVGRQLEELTPIDSNQEDAGAQEGEGESLSDRIKEAEGNTNVNPTEAQNEAGNYKKGHVQVGAFDITIKQPKGSVRKGVDAGGNKWETTMRNTYGYIRGTEGVDGDHIDVFLSDDIDGWNGRRVFVVDQYNEDGTFDEHKVMLGFNEQEEAEAAYFANYEKDWGKKHKTVVTPVNLEDFEKRVDSSHRKTKAFAEYRASRKDSKLKWSNERALNGEPFLIGENGSIDLLILPDEILARMRIGKIPFRLTPSIVEHVYERHHDELKLRSKEDAVKAILNVMNNFDHVRRGDRDNTFVFSIEGDRTKSARRAITFVLEYDKGQWIGIKTVGYDRVSDIKKMTILWEKGEKTSATGVATANVTSEQPLQSDQAGGIASNQSAVISENKDNKPAAEKQADGLKSSELYSITPAQYTTKRGKVLDMQLVTPKVELSKDGFRSANALAKSLKGWFDAKQRGFLMRSEEDAIKLAEHVELMKGTKSSSENIIQMINRIAKEAEEKKRKQAESAGKTHYEVHPVSTSLRWGKVYQWGIGSFKDAVDFLMNKKDGMLKGVFYRDEIGEIGVGWGVAPNDYNGRGLSHIVRKHVYKLHDFSDVDEMIRVVEDVINHGVVRKDKDGSYAIEKDTYRVVVVKDEDGAWVLSAFDYVNSKKAKAKRKDTAALGTPGQSNVEAGAVTSNLSENKDNELASEKQLLNENEIRESPFSEITKDGATAYINGNINFATSVAYQQIYSYVRDRSENNQSNSTGRSAAQRIAAVDEASGGRGGLNGVQTGRMAGEKDQPGGSQNSKRVGVLSDGAGSDTAVRGEISADGGLPSGDTRRTGGRRTGRKGDNVRKPESERGSSGTVGEPVEEAAHVVRQMCDILSKRQVSTVSKLNPNDAGNIVSEVYVVDEEITELHKVNICYFR